ncbi:hypothetical protein [Pseudonocardia sp.]|uniref:hypothetical protein n=1 Tax=Pseudonocardia sp. TaxID=60912 RepID=UPI003D112FBF
MPPSVRSVSTASHETGTITVNKPAGTVSGDRLVAIVTRDEGAGTQTSGSSLFTKLNESIVSGRGRVQVWTRTAGGSEPSSYTFTESSGNSTGTVHLFALQDVDPSAVVVASYANGSSTSASAPSIATSGYVGTDPLLLTGYYVLNSYASTTFSTPSGMTGQGTIIPTGNYTRAFAASLGLSGTVATGSRTSTLSVSKGWIAVSVAVPSVAAPAQDLFPQLLASAATIGEPTVAAGAVPLAADVVGSVASVGQPTVAPGPVALAVQAVGSVATVGLPQPLGQTVTGTGIASGEAFGDLTVNAGLTLGPSGITSGEAFGDAALTVGAVTVTLTGVASGETFGTASVTPLLQPTGIASAEAFGSAAVTAGVVSVTVTGIASGEAFGSGAVSVGSVSVTATGIASGEAFGSAQVNLQIVGSGIVSGEAFGSPSLGIGGVSVTLTGIASAEAFGDANLTVTIDPTVRGTSRLARRDVYELVCVARIMTASSSPTFLEVERIEWKTLTWTNELSAPQGLTARCPVSSVSFPVAQRLADPARLPTELWLTRNGQMVFAGPLLGWRRNGDDLDLTAAGLMKYLQVMFVLTDPELRFDQVDQHTIAAQLVNQWQNTVPYGNFGIDTSSVAPSGTLRDRSYVRNEIHEVLRRVQELGQIDGGFDSEVDPTTRKLQLWTPTKGVDRSSGGDAIVLDDRNINSLDVMCSVAPGDLASMAFGASSAGGSDTSLWSQAVNDDLRAAYGAAGVTGSWSDISEQTTLDGHVSALLGARDRALLVPGPKARVTTDSDIGSYDVGDTISCEMDSLLGVSGAFRIRKRTVDVDESGQETATLEFV